VRGTDEVDHGHAGGQPKRLDLGRRGHPGADLLLEVVEVVAEFFEAGVDATGARVGFGDLRAASDVEGEVGGGELDRLPVQQIPAASGEHTPYGTEPGGDVLT